MAWNDFQTRVNRAAAAFVRGPGRDGFSRSVDQCFEEFDGDYVCLALIRRAQKNERLRVAVGRYLAPDVVEQVTAELGHVKNIAEAAASCREKARASFA